MRKIIASLDIGTNSIKLIVGEIYHSKLNVLACINSPSSGIKNGFIVNYESAEVILKDVFKKAEELLGLPVKKVLVNVPSYNLDCFLTSGSIIIKSEDKSITHSDVMRAMKASVYNKLEDNRELVTILPTKYIINDEETVTSPINVIANKLTINDVAVSIPKKNSEIIIKTLEKIGIEVVDICISPLSDFYEFKNPEMMTQVGAVVNIGHSNTTVSIINKGILTGCEVLDLGANAIDSDIAYVFKVSKKDAKFLKEKLAIADIHMAKPSESLIIKDIHDENTKINEYDVSAVVISRLEEIFNLVKKQINLLTKKKISYIIVTGGISELDYFEDLVSNIFGNVLVYTKTSEIGARDNKYSVALGMIKYYDSRLKLRNAEFSIFSLDEQEEFGGTHKRVNISENSLLGKIYGYFFDN